MGTWNISCATVEARIWMTAFHQSTTLNNKPALLCLPCEKCSQLNFCECIFFEYPKGKNKLWSAKKMFHSEVTGFPTFLRSVIEAKSAYLPLLGWKVCAIAILLNVLISIENYARSCWTKFIHCLAHMHHKLIWF